MLLPKMMAGFNCLGRWSDCDAQKQMNHLEEYFSKGTTYLYDIEDIRKHAEQYNYESEYPIKESGIYNDKERLENPLVWFNNLKLSMNAETIFLQFVSTADGKPICDPLCAENDFFGGAESPCISMESVMSGYGLKWITKNHPDYHCYETGDFSTMQKENDQ